MPFWFVMSCQLCFLPGDSHPWQVLANGAPPVCTRTTWTHLGPRNLPVQRLSGYTLVIHSYHMSKPWSQRSLLSLSMSSMLCCPVLTLKTSSFVTLSFQKIPKMLLCHLRWAAFSLFVSVAVSGHTSALYRRIDRTIASYNLIFTFRLIHLFFHIFLIFPNTAVAFPMRTLTSFSQFPLELHLTTTELWFGQEQEGILP